MSYFTRCNVGCWWVVRVQGSRANVLVIRQYFSSWSVFGRCGIMHCCVATKMRPPRAFQSAKNTMAKPVHPLRQHRCEELLVPCHLGGLRFRFRWMWCMFNVTQYVQVQNEGNTVTNTSSDRLHHMCMSPGAVTSRILANCEKSYTAGKPFLFHPTLEPKISRWRRNL